MTATAIERMWFKPHPQGPREGEASENIRGCVVDVADVYGSVFELSEE